MNLTKEFIKSDICERYYFNMTAYGVYESEVADDFFCEVKPEKAAAIIVGLIKKVPMPPIYLLRQEFDYKIIKNQEIFYTIREYIKGNIDTLLETLNLSYLKYNNISKEEKNNIKSIDVPICILNIKTKDEELKKELYEIMIFLME